MISKKISDFLSLVQEQQQLCNIALANLKKCEAATQDILHKIELEPIKYKERARLATKLQQIRRERRCAKDLYELTKIIAEWAGSHKSTIGELQRLLGEVRKAENKQRNRIYIPRTDITEENDE